MALSDQFEKKPLSDTICEILRKDILSGVLKPGERLMEIHYAKKLGVSRTPFREAIRKLEIEGLVTVWARRGAHVSLLSPREIGEVLDIRSALDMLAIGLFIERASDREVAKLREMGAAFSKAMQPGSLLSQVKADVDFHEFIYNKTGNDRLLQIYMGFKDQLYRYRVLYLNNELHSETVAREHEQIIDAVEQRDAPLAKKFAEIHIINQKNNFK